MTKLEIQEFIESMEEIGDTWEEADVERVYGTMTLEDALKDRRSALHMHFENLGKYINK